MAMTISSASCISNRIDTNSLGNILDRIHAQIPMVTVDDQSPLQHENADADQKFWEVLYDLTGMRQGRRPPWRAAAKVTDYGCVLITPGKVGGITGWNTKSLPGTGLRKPAALTTVGTSKKVPS
jgi:hypothetical protein